MRKVKAERPFAEMPYEEYQRRVDQAKERMARSGVDALLLFSPTNIRYYTGWVKASTVLGPWLRRSALIPRRGDPVLIGSRTEITRITTWVEDTRERLTYPSNTQPFIDLFVEAVRDLKLDGKVLGIDLDPWYPSMWGLDVSPKDIESIQKNLPRTKFVEAYELCREQRMVKTPYEIELMRACCDITVESFQKGLEAAKKGIREGITEAEINHIIWQTFISKGGLVSDPVLVGRMTIDAYERRLTMPLDRKLAPGDQITYNGGGCYRGYHSDVSRVISVGEPTAKQKKLYEAARLGGDAAIESLQPGRKASEVYHAANKAVGKAYRNIQIVWIAAGHGIGMDSHEPPYLSPDVDIVLKPGMVIAVEVIINDPETKLFGGTTEDNFLITEDGCENLTGSPGKLSREILII